MSFSRYGNQENSQGQTLSFLSTLHTLRDVYAVELGYGWTNSANIGI